MEALGVVASIIAVVQLTGKVTSLGYSYISGVKRASKDLRDLLIELSSLTEVLAVLQDYVEKDLQQSAFKTLADKGGPLLECAKELEELQYKLESRDGLRGVLDNLKWPLKESETLQHISRIERYKSLFTLALTADHISLSRAIDSNVQQTKLAISDVRVFAEDTNITIHNLQKDLRTGDITRSLWEQENQALRLAKKRKSVLQWLYPKPFDTKHIEVSNQRQRNTGNWLLKSPEFQGWTKSIVTKDQPYSTLLWGHGIPGAGKTFLCSLVIDHFEDQVREARYGVAYVYFDYTERENQRPVDVLASLVKQLASQVPKLPRAVERLYDKLDGLGKRPTLNDLYTALILIKDSFFRTFLIFDALDECDQEKQRNELLPIFERMGKDGIHIFFTSRPYPEDIQNSFDKVANIAISAQEGDIRTYIEETINKNRRARRLVQQSNCKEKIMEELVDCAKGMFLLVRFHVDYLCQQTTAKQILTALEKIRSSSINERPLDPTYDRAMENIHRQSISSVNLARKILSWLLGARRVLTVDEIRVAVSVEPNRYELDELDLLDRATLLDVCAGLVTIDIKTDTIRLAHYTVQEYLIKNSVVPEIDFELAVTCTTYLSFKVFAQSPGGSHEELRDRDILHPFLRYAAHNFATHLMACDEKATTDIFLEFLDRPGNIATYFQALRPLPNPRTRGLISLYFTINERDPRRLYPLHLAATIGHYAVVQELLAKGHSISAVDNEGRTALYNGVVSGKESIVQLLLDNGADISVADNSGHTVLHLAAQKGDERLVRLLVARGANLNAQDNSLETPLDKVPRGKSLLDVGTLGSNTSHLAHIMVQEYGAIHGGITPETSHPNWSYLPETSPVGNPGQFIPRFQY